MQDGENGLSTKLFVTRQSPDATTWHQTQASEATAEQAAEAAAKAANAAPAERDASNGMKPDAKRQRRCSSAPPATVPTTAELIAKSVPQGTQA